MNIFRQYQFQTTRIVSLLVRKVMIESHHNKWKNSKRCYVIVKKTMTDSREILCQTML